MKTIFLIFTIIVLTVVILNFNKMKIIEQNAIIPMPKELKEYYGKIPILEEFDTLTWMTAAWWFSQDEEGNIINYQGYYYDENLKKIKGLYNPLNKGNFKKGYMFGIDEEGKPKQVWEE